MSLRSSIILNLMRKTLDFNKPLEEIRKDLDQMKVKKRIKETTYIEEVVIESVPCTWIIPKDGSTDKFVYYLHGGGYCLGITETVRQHAVDIAEVMGLAVLLIDYALSPEAPYPTSIEQVNSVYRHLANKRKICILGESSGCGLAVNLMVSLRDNKEIQPDCAVLITPFLDATYKSNSNETMRSIDPFCSEEQFSIVSHYTKGLDPSTPMISPLFHDVHDLAPMLIHVAEYDTLADDGRILYNKVKASGSEVEFKEWKKLWHVFHMQYPIIPEAKKALLLCKEYIHSKI